MTQIREWTLVEEIGRGGMGVVYKATHKFMKGEYALKSIKPELAQDPEVHDRFLQEAHNATGLDHPNIVKSLPPFEEEGGLYLPMEFLVGQPLDELRSIALNRPDAVMTKTRPRIVEKLD